MRLIFRFSIFPILIALLIIQGCGNGSGSQKLPFQTEYQAVFIVGGQVFFGKAELGPEYFTLRDVFYIHSQEDQRTKEISRSFLRRGQEPHGPNLMYINKNQIVFIESVSPESKIGKLIGEAKAAVAPAQK
jgi:hypothetical protein